MRLANAVQSIFAPVSRTIFPHFAISLCIYAARCSGEDSGAPELPTIGETVPGYEVTTWTAMYAPAGTPREVVQRVAAEMARLQKSREYTDRLVQIGSDAPESSPEHLAGYMQSEIAKWGKIVRETGARID